MSVERQYEIRIEFHDEGDYTVHAGTWSQPFRIFDERGWDLHQLVAQAQDAISEHRLKPV